EALSQVEGEAAVLRRRPVQPFAVSFGAGVERDDGSFIPQRGTLGEFVRIGADRQVCPIDTIELGRVRMDVNEKLSWVIGSDESVPVGGRLSQSSTDSENEVGRPNARGKFWIRTMAQVAGIDRRRGRQCVLPAERRRDRETQA